MKIHSKMVSLKEREIILLLKELNLWDCTLIYNINENNLEEYEGHHVGRTQWDILKIYKEVIQPFHKIKSTSFSVGVYSFIEIDSVLANNETYLDYLLREILRMLEIPCCDSYSQLRREILASARYCIERLIKNDIEIKEFSLLHGDLYNGNILIHNNRYAVIDFEYLRFGPSLMEWAFLLFWDLVVCDKRDNRRKIIKKILLEIRILIDNGILSKNDIELICDIYLPIILGFSLHNAINNNYLFNDTIIKGIELFWKFEYKIIRTEIGIYEKM